jgi:hypothetical protein
VKIRTSVAGCAGVAVVALLLAGCGKKNDTPEAVRQGVIRDISKSFNVSNMDVVVDSVSFRDKEADATVTFMLKGGAPNQGMSMRYVMERHDDGQWYIKSRASAAGAEGAPGASGELPMGHPGMGGAPGGAAGGTGSALNMPPDHPVLGQ